MATKREQITKRFSALLLFQFRVMVDGDPGKRRICEKRIIHFRARNGRSALEHAKTRGRESEYHYKNSQGNDVFFEFIGVKDLMGLGAECEDDEVWYQIVQMMTPMERKSQIIPPESELAAILNKE